jgi:MFS family permease
MIGIPSGMLADKIGKEKVLTIGYAVFAVSSLLMVILTGNSLFAYVLAAVFGLYMGISETLQRAIIPRYISSELRGTAYGIYNLVIGSGFFISNVIFGFLWDKYNVNVGVYYSLITSLAAITGMFLFVGKYPSGKSPSQD